MENIYVPPSATLQNFLAIYSYNHYTRWIVWRDVTTIYRDQIFLLMACCQKADDNFVVCNFF